MAQSSPTTTSYNPGSSFTPTSGFGARTNPVTGLPENHPGQDYAAPIGTAIPAASNGVVVYSGLNSAGLGYCTIIKSYGVDSQPYYTLYAHQDGYSMTPVGYVVLQGQKIGEVGNTGLSIGPHLHFEVLTGSTPVNPNGTGSIGFAGSAMQYRYDPNSFTDWQGGHAYGAGSPVPAPSSTGGQGGPSDAGDWTGGQGYISEYETLTSTGDVMKTNMPNGTLQMDVSGTNVTISQSNATLYIANGETATVTGNNVSVFVGSNACVKVVGPGDQITANGTSDIITIGGNGAGGTGSLTDTVHGNGAAVSILDNSNVNVFDSYAKITAGQNDNFGAYGAGLSVTAGTGSSVWVGMNGVNSTGSSSDLASGTAGTVTIVNNSNVTVTESNAKVVGGTQDYFGVAGSNDNVTAQSGDSVWIGGNGQNSSSIDTLTANGATCTINDNSRVNVFDTNATIYGGANDNFGAYGAGLTVNGTATDNVWAGSNGVTGTLINVWGAPYVAITDNSNVMVHGATTVLGGATDDIGLQNSNNPTVTINGNNSDFYTWSPNTITYDYGTDDMSANESTNDTTYNYGTYDQVNNTSTYDTSFQDNSFQQGYDQSSTDIINNNFSTDVIDPSFTPDFGEFGFPGFAGTRSTVATNIASHVLPAAASAVADAATESQMFARLQLAINTDAHSMVTGARFDHVTILWSFDSSQTVTSAEAAAAQSAFNAWAAASGLHFQKAANGHAADIVLSFANLQTGTSGLVGFTSVHTSSGVVQPGALVQIENPSETPLVADANGQLVYSGTEATLTQVITHEVGHALGLAANADPTSIESYYLGAGNRTISAADANTVHSVYSGPGFGGAYVSPDVQALMNEFASFAPAQGAGAVHLVGVAGFADGVGGGI
jgi:predicted Zn-dependent protease